MDSIRRALKCGGADCSRTFPVVGNRRYCSADCSGNARKVQDRQAQRRRRYPSHLLTAAKAAQKGQVSAVPTVARRFRLLLRPLPQRDRPASPAVRRLLRKALLLIVETGSEAPLAALPPAATVAARPPGTASEAAPARWSSPWREMILRQRFARERSWRAHARAQTRSPHPRAGSCPSDPGQLRLARSPPAPRTT